MRIFSIFVCPSTILWASLWATTCFAADPTATSTQLICAHLLRNGQFDQVRAVLKEDRKAAVQTIDQMRYENSPETRALKKHWAALFAGDLISTPLEDLAHFSKQMNFKAGQTLIDIGSGHGDPGFVFGALNPGLEIVGYDIVKAKVDGANRTANKLGLNNVRFIQQDLSDPDFILPEADYYYVFNPVNEDILISIAKKIKMYSEHRDIKVLVFSGGWAPRVFERLDFLVDHRYQGHDFQVFSTKPPPFKQNLKISELKNAKTARLLERYKIFKQEQVYVLDETSKKIRGQRAQYKKALFDALGERPAKERLRYLQQVLRGGSLIHDDELIDALAGLRIPELDKKLNEDLVLNSGIKRYSGEEIWYGPKAQFQTRWIELLAVVEKMSISWHQQTGVADLGSGIGRLGILIGALYPRATFTGIEIVEERVRNANRAARELGFKNVKYVAANLGDPHMDLPLAEHIYMFNPTNAKTSDILTHKLLELARRIHFDVYLLTVFQSRDFRKYFDQAENSSHGPQVFRRNQTPAP